MKKIRIGLLVAVVLLILPLGVLAIVDTGTETATEAEAVPPTVPEPVSGTGGSEEWEPPDLDKVNLPGPIADEETAPVPELYSQEAPPPLPGTTGANKRQAKGQTQGQGQNRCSQVANAVQELLLVGDRQAGVGEQIRLIARSQEKHQERIEAALGEAKKRNRFVKFLIGPKYKQLERIRNEFQAQNQELNQLRNLLGQITNEVDENTISEQLAVLDAIKAELEAEFNKEMKGVSLFGWLNKLLSGLKG